VDRPAVEDAPPPKAVLRLLNPLLVALLRSPLHGLASKNFMLLTVTGRKSGRTYTFPIGRHEEPDGTFVLSAGGNWRHNLRGGADVRVTLRVEPVSERVRRLPCRIEADHELLALGRLDREAIGAERPHFDGAVLAPG
jgi:deazaflavin-dependent oxidoreductase (nitroreductase family)